MNYLIFLAIGVILLFPFGDARAQNYVGILLSGYEKDCDVVHQGSSYRCEERKQLYVGDVVSKKPSVKALKIKWAPYFNGLIKSETSLVVQTVPAGQMKGSIHPGNIRQYIKDFVKPVSYGAVPLVTRGSRKRALQLQQSLPLRATLIQAFPLVASGFRDGNRISAVTVVDEKGQKIHEEAFSGGAPVALRPTRMGLQPRQRYKLTINGEASGVQIDVAVMDRPEQEEITRGFADIDAAGGEASEVLMRKIGYLQLVSDAYPGRFDLYWLGQQLLQESPQKFTKDEEEIVRQFIQRYNQHNR